jgi:hypothetical protein
MGIPEHMSIPDHTRQVSGHEFTRADKREKNLGFSPCAANLAFLRASVSGVPDEPAVGSVGWLSPWWVFSGVLA